MRRVITTTMFAATMMLALPIGSHAVEVQSLRGGEINVEKPEAAPSYKQITAKGGIARSYETQPPLIPHTIDKDRIDLKSNSCMRCHSEKNFEKEKAPKVGDSHYETREGKTLATTSSRRYVCTSCHVPQSDTNPLVQNNF
ncbi:MAG: nitrate reductase cytochrome c-type subunit [Gammaproteobacteria bacterium]|nr:nitrate reductase cytochrome c-type subunit [Gammaproteobacteria bacterium]